MCVSTPSRKSGADMLACLPSGFPSQPPSTCQPARLQDCPFLRHTSQVVSDSTHSSIREKTLNLRTETEGHLGPFPTSLRDYGSRKKECPGPLLPSSPLTPIHGCMGIFRHRLKSPWSALTSAPQIETLPPSSPTPKPQKLSSSSSPALQGTSDLALCCGNGAYPPLAFEWGDLGHLEIN